MSHKEAVLSLLKSNARLSVSEISDGLDIAEDAVRLAINELEDSGVILGYQAIINESKVEDSDKRVLGLIEVRVRPEKRVGFSEVAKRIYQFSNVIDHYLVSGNYDFMLVVEGETIQEISSFVSQKLASIENVESTRTHFIMERYKQKGVIFDKNHTGERLKVSL